MRAAATILRRPSRREGFSLLEVLIAMVILTVGATSLIALFAAASRTHKRAIDRTRAALVAEGLFADVQARYHVGVDLKDLLKQIETIRPEQIDGYYWEIRLHQPGLEGSRRGDDFGEAAESWEESELVVRIAIRWGQGAQAREEVYSTVLLPEPARGGG